MKDIETIQNAELSKSQQQATTAQFENKTQELTQDLSLKQISQVLIQNWPLFFILFFVLTSVSVAVYGWKVPFVSTASVIVNDSQNSSLQSFTQQFTGSMAAKLNEAKKSNSPLQKYLEFLKTTEFYSKLITSVEVDMDSQKLSVPEKIGQQKFLKEILYGKKVSELNDEEQTNIYRKLESLLKYKIATDYELEISTASKTKELSLFLTNAALKVIAEELQKKESAELFKIQGFLNAQKSSIDAELQNLNKKLSDFSSKPENLFSLGSSAKVGDYISELMMRKNEVRMKISENNKMISYLKSSSTGRKENPLYGNAGRAQAIELENEMLSSKLKDIQKSIDLVSNQVKNLPSVNQSYEDIKKKSEIEFSKYKEVSEALSKTEAYQLSLANKFEVLEKARIEKVQPLVSLFTLILVSFVLSQVLGSLIIYVTTIWDSSLVTSQSTRNVVVIDSHSLDPRVIIENSKIKFRLRNSEFDSRQIGENNSENEKIGFNFIKQDDAEDQKSGG